MKQGGDVEYLILGCLLLDNDCYCKINLNKDDFTIYTNGIIFETIQSFIAQGKPIAAVIISDYLEDNPAIKQLGPTFFFKLISEVISTANVSAYAEIVKSRATLATLATLLAKSSQSTQLPQADASLIAQDIVQQVSLLLPSYKTAKPLLANIMDFIQEDIPYSWLIKHWIPAQALVMINAKPGIGKTFLALDIALHIASNKPFWMDNIVHGGSVIYLAGEGHIGLKKRIKAWVQYHNAAQINLFISNRGLQLNTPEGLLETTNAIERSNLKPILIVVDTVHRFMQGDVSDYEEANKLVKACDNLKQLFGATIILVHHTGHSDDSRGMGSRIWRMSIDIDINISEEGKLIKVKQTKDRDDEAASSLLLEFHKVIINGCYDEDNEPVSSVILRQSHEEVMPQLDDAKIKEDADLFIEIWVWAGKELNKEQQPWIACDLMAEYLVQKKNFKAKWASQLVRRKDKNRFPGRLYHAELINLISIENAQYWIIYDENLVSVAHNSNMQ